MALEGADRSSARVSADIAVVAEWRMGKRRRETRCMLLRDNSLYFLGIRVHTKTASIAYFLQQIIGRNLATEIDRITELTRACTYYLLYNTTTLTFPYLLFSYIHQRYPNLLIVTPLTYKTPIPLTNPVLQHNHIFLTVTVEMHTLRACQNSLSISSRVCSYKISVYIITFSKETNHRYYTPTPSRPACI